MKLNEITRYDVKFEKQDLLYFRESIAKCYGNRTIWDLLDDCVYYSPLISAYEKVRLSSCSIDRVCERFTGPERHAMMVMLYRVSQTCDDKPRKEWAAKTVNLLETEVL